MRLCDQVLKLEADSPGESDEEMVVPADVWARLVGQAKVEAGRTKHYVAREAGKTLDAMLRDPHGAKPYDLGIIACSATKLPGGPHAARDLYQGEHFKLALAAAEKLCTYVCVVSAKHFVVGLSARLDSYDVRLEANPTVWAEKVNASLGNLIRQHGKRVLCLAPASYWGHLMHAGWDKPLQGLGIGRQKAALAEMVRAKAAA